MNLKEARYRLARNNQKCYFCKHWYVTRSDNTSQLCRLIGEYVEENYTCDYWGVV